jgi:catechol 2,3-dioxygenase-like lactoylglutathione lyase family enzyme
MDSGENGIARRPPAFEIGSVTRCHSVATTETRFMIKRIKFASIPVSNQDRALEFYTTKLGFKLITDQQFDDDQRWIELRIPGGETGVVLFTPDEHRDRIGTAQHISFMTDDVEKTFQELAAKGVQFDGEPQKMEWGTFVTFRDPDGNRFVLGTK